MLGCWGRYFGEVAFGLIGDMNGWSLLSNGMGYDCVVLVWLCTGVLFWRFQTTVDLVAAVNVYCVCELYDDVGF